MSTRYRVLIPLALVLLVTLAGCGAANVGSGGDGARQSGQSGSADLGGGTAMPEATQSAGGGDGGGGGSAAPLQMQVQSRSIIRTGHVTLEVERFDRSRHNLTRATKRYGGFVGATHEENHAVDNESYATGRVVLRVPRENYSALSAEVMSEGRVLEASNETEDVTEQLVDLEARLENLRSERDRLRELYQKANETEDVLAVEKRLSEVQTEIERIEARQQSLRRQVAYSTITVELREPRPDPGPFERSRWYDTPIPSAFVDSVHGVAVVLRALVVGFAYALPYLIVFAPVAAVGYLGWRRFGR